MDDKIYKILVINPGSTSTKIAFFNNEDKLWEETIRHEKGVLASFKEIQDQLPYRAELVEKACEERGVDLKDVDIFAGRGGGMVSCPGGVYEVNDILIHDCQIGAGGAMHPANLASQIAHAMGEKYGGWCCVANSPDVDEMMDIARPTGLNDVWRKSSSHFLNQKEIAYRYAKSIGKEYEDVNLVIAHIGGGISVAAHRKGLVIDTTDLISGGDAPMMPTRSGAIAPIKIVDLCFSGKYDKKAMYERITRKGGLMDHLGTDNAIEIENRIKDGDKYAEIVYNAMILQIAKQIAAMAVSLDGKVDQIILTGGISNSKYVVEKIKEHAGWVGEYTVMAGEFEMEALAAAGLRAKRGEVPVQTYTGIPMFKNFDDIKK